MIFARRVGHAKEAAQRPAPTTGSPASANRVGAPSGATGTNRNGSPLSPPEESASSALRSPFRAENGSGNRDIRRWIREHLLPGGRFLVERRIATALGGQIARSGAERNCLARPDRASMRLVQAGKWTSRLRSRGRPGIAMPASAEAPPSGVRDVSKRLAVGIATSSGSSCRYPKPAARPSLPLPNLTVLGSAR